MQLDEAVAIQSYILRGLPVQEQKVREAQKIIQANQARCWGENRSWCPEALSTAQRDRVNMILAYKLALACRKLDAWKVAA